MWDDDSSREVISPDVLPRWSRGAAADALGDAPLGDPASRLRALNCSLVGLLGEPPAAGGAAPCLGMALVHYTDPGVIKPNPHGVDPAVAEYLSMGRPVCEFFLFLIFV